VGAWGGSTILDKLRPHQAGTSIKGSLTLLSTATCTGGIPRPQVVLRNQVSLIRALKTPFFIDLECRFEDILGIPGIRRGERI